MIVEFYIVGVFYYQASPYYTNPYSNAMFLQYRSQPLLASPSRTSAYVAGNRIEAGSYVRGIFHCFDLNHSLVVKFTIIGHIL